MFNYVAEVVYIPRNIANVKSVSQLLFNQRFPKFTVTSPDSYYVYIPAISPEPIKAEILSTPGFAIHYDVGAAVVVAEVENATSFDYMIIGTLQSITGVLALKQLDVDILHAREGTLAEQMTLANKMTIKLLLDTIDSLQNKTSSLQSAVDSLQNQLQTVHKAVSALYSIKHIELITESNTIFYVATGEYIGHPLDNVIFSLTSGSISYTFNALPEYNKWSRTFTLKIDITTSASGLVSISQSQLMPECKSSNIIISTASTAEQYAVSNNVTYHLNADNSVTLALVLH